MAKVWIAFRQNDFKKWKNAYESHFSHEKVNASKQLFTSLSKALTIPACWFKKRFLNLELLMYIHYITIISPWKMLSFERKNNYKVVNVVLSLGNGHDLSIKQSWITFTKGCFVSSLVEVIIISLEKIFQSGQCIFTICHYCFPVVKDVALHLN